jgi:hypothetical protein
MSEPTPNGESGRTNLAPILAPIITLFIGFGAGVVFSEFIPLGKAPVIQTTPNPGAATGHRDSERERQGEAIDVEAETRKALEEAAAEGDEAAQKALDDLDADNKPADPPGDGG